MAKSRVSKNAPKAAPELAAAEIVFNAQTGDILHEKNANVQRDPASLTKLMTAYMVMRAVESGKVDLDDKITISKGAAQQQNNTFKVNVRQPDGTMALSDTLPPGCKLTIREALAVMMTSSANGVAKALGEALAPSKLDAKGRKIPGSERDFAREMTQVARNELMMKNSSFINASGMNDGGPEQKSNLTTAHDLALLNYQLMKRFPQYEPLLSAPSVATNVIMPDGSRQRVTSFTTNSFVSSHGSSGNKDGFIASGPQKTGYNELTGGINLLTTAENRDGVRLSSIVLGGRTSDSRYAANLKNLRDGFAQVKADPQLAQGYTHKGGFVTVAAVSPASAFAEKGRAGKYGPSYNVAQKDVSPRSRFNKAGHRHDAAPSGGVVTVGYTAPVAEVAPSAPSAPEGNALVDMRQLERSTQSNPAVPSQADGLGRIENATPPQRPVAPEI